TVGWRRICTTTSRPGRSAPDRQNGESLADQLAADLAAKPRAAQQAFLLFARGNDVSPQHFLESRLQRKTKLRRPRLLQRRGIGLVHDHHPSALRERARGGADHWGTQLRGDFV